MTAAVSSSNRAHPARRAWRLPAPNPVLVKELRGHFRGARAFAVLTAFLVILAALALKAYNDTFGAWPTMSWQLQSNGWGMNEMAAVGRDLFNAVAWAEALLVALIAPALTMTAVSGEVERQTWDLLLATPLSTWSILRGKIATALAYVTLLVLAALPVMSVAFVFGGVSPAQLVLVQLAMLAMGLLFVVVGVFWSTVLQRTVRAAMATYLTVTVMLIQVVVVIYLMTTIAWVDMSGLNVDTLGSLLNALLFSWPLVGVAVLTGMMGSSNDLVTTRLAVTQSLLAQPLVAAVFYILAGARVRRTGRRTVVAMLAVVGLLAVLWGWVAVSNALSFP
jgi:ABC-type transport system involved in multi-copper enzyme maturation permease subunit